MPRQGARCILIGHTGHPEVEGTMGQYRPARRTAASIWSKHRTMSAKLVVQQSRTLAFVTQTTLSMDDTARIIEALQRTLSRPSSVRSKDDICYATQNRQDAVKELVRQCDLILVVGSHQQLQFQSSARDSANVMAVPAYLIDNADQIRRMAGWQARDRCHRRRLRAGDAGAAGDRALQARGAQLTEEQHGREETITFALPQALRRGA